MKNRFKLLIYIITLTALLLTSCSIVDTNEPTGENAAPIITDTVDSAKDTTLENNKLSTEKTESETNIADSKKTDSDNKMIAVISNSYAYYTPEQLEEKADAIFIGEYTGESTQTVPDPENCESDFPAAVYTNYSFKVTKVIKGDLGESLYIRRSGGTIGGTVYVNQNQIELKENCKYLIYAINGISYVKDDIQTYVVITNNCFEIDEEENIITNGTKQDDINKIQAVYDTAVNK